MTPLLPYTTHVLSPTTIPTLPSSTRPSPELAAATGTRATTSTTSPRGHDRLTSTPATVVICARDSARPGTSSRANGTPSRVSTTDITSARETVDSPPTPETLTSSGSSASTGDSSTSQPSAPSSTDRK